MKSGLSNILLVLALSVQRILKKSAELSKTHDARAILDEFFVSKVNVKL